MPHGGNPNSLCHTPGPAHPPDPQVSPFLSLQGLGVSQGHVPEAASPWPTGAAPRQSPLSHASSDGSRAHCLTPPALHFLPRHSEKPPWVGCQALGLPLGVPMWMEPLCLRGISAAEKDGHRGACRSAEEKGGCGETGRENWGQNFLTLGRSLPPSWSGLWPFQPLYPEPAKRRITGFLPPASPSCRPRRARQTCAAFLKTAFGVLSCSHTPGCSPGPGVPSPTPPPASETPLLLGSRAAPRQPLLCAASTPVPRPWVPAMSTSHWGLDPGSPSLLRGSSGAPHAC